MKDTKKTIEDRTIQTVKEGSKRPLIKTGFGLGAATLATLLLNPDVAYAAQDVAQKTVENYGFFSGMLDGILTPINLIMSAFTDSTWARDGTGIASEPANFGYNLGFLFGCGGLCRTTITYKRTPE